MFVHCIVRTSYIAWWKLRTWWGTTWWAHVPHCTPWLHHWFQETTDEALSQQLLEWQGINYPLLFTVYSYKCCIPIVPHAMHTCFHLPSTSMSVCFYDCIVAICCTLFLYNHCSLALLAAFPIILLNKCFLADGLTLPAIKSCSHSLTLAIIKPIATCNHNYLSKQHLHPITFKHWL